jgi:acyl-CoA thioester hydrolase
MTFRHSITVRYGECDMQGVVFNAHYLAFADDAIAQWFRAALPADAMYVAGNGDATFDFMVKKATVTWVGGSTFGDVLDLDCTVGRWGTTSFDVHVRGSVGGEERVEIVLVYVSVAPGTHRPCPVPENLKALLAA